MKWRAEFIKADRAKTPKNPNMRIRVKIQVTEVTEIVEDVTKFFNVFHCTARSTENTFFRGGQYPWKDCEVEFKDHLDAPSKLYIYSNIIKISTAGRIPADDGVVFNNYCLTINFFATNNICV